MCEPSHSIIQYNDPNSPEDDDDFTGSAQAGSFTIGNLTSGLTKWAKKIKKWMHLSQMGNGHSETIGNRSLISMYKYHEVFGLYEAHWWNRSVICDGGAAQRGIKLDCATEYANLVSIGDMTQLRRFLKTSMQNSNRPQNYVDQFRNGFLNTKGKTSFDNRFAKVFKKKPTFYNVRNVVKNNLEGVTKFIAGYTRKRTLIVPEWADDTGIWKP